MPRPRRRFGADRREVTGRGQKSRMRDLPAGPGSLWRGRFRSTAKTEFPHAGKTRHTTSAVDPASGHPFLACQNLNPASALNQEPQQTTGRPSSPDDRYKLTKPHPTRQCESNPPASASSPPAHASRGRGERGTHTRARVHLPISPPSRSKPPSAAAPATSRRRRRSSTSRGHRSTGEPSS